LGDDREMQRPTSSNPHVVKAPSSADMLALVPHLLGYHPQESLVLVAFHGKRTCGAMRFDLPSTASKAIHKRIATQMAGMLCKIRAADGVVAGIFTEVATSPASDLPHSDFANVLRGKLNHAGFDIKDVLFQGSSEWGSYLDAVKHPLSDVIDSPIHDELRAIPELKDHEVGRSQIEIDSAVPTASAAETTAMRKQLDHIQSVMDDFITELHHDAEVGNEDDGPVASELLPLMDLPELFEAAIRWTPAELAESGPILLHAIQQPAVRDSAMIQWASSKRVGYLSLQLTDRLHAESHGMSGRKSKLDERAEKELGDLMFGIGPRPDVERVLAAIDLLRILTSLVIGAERRAPLCMMAWLNWGLGRGSIAGVYIDEARSIDGSYGMVEVLSTMLHNGMFPEWAFNHPV
jgi:hypothetical protein